MESISNVFKTNECYCPDCGKHLGMQIFNKMLCDDCSAKREFEKAEEKRKEHEEAEERRRVRVSEAKANDYEDFLKRAGVGLRHMKCTFKNFVGDYSKAREWVESESTENLLIQSAKSGNGKTHMAVATMRALFDKKELDPARDLNRNCGKFTTFSNMMLTARATFKSKEDDESDYIDFLQSVKVLVIDDIGAEKVTEYAQSFLYAVIDGRYQNMLPTIITTNLTSAELSEAYGSRMLSRMASGTFIEIKGHDERIAKRYTRDDAK